MKLRNTIIIVIALVMGVTTGCNKEELENLRQENQELSQTLEEKNQTIQELKQMNNQINQNLQLIIEKKGEADAATLKNIQGDQLRKRLTRLNEMVRTSDKEAESIRNELRGAQAQAIKYKKQVTQLQEDLKSHEDSIREINKDLMAKMQRIEEMTEKMEEKDTTIAKLQKENEDYLTQLRKKSKILNTAYLATGAEKELEDKGVIKKKGGFLGIFGQTAVLNPDFNQSHFREFDKTNELSVTIDAKKKKVEVVTPQPENSYEFEAGEGDQTVLKITDEDQFWRACKYLVITY